MEDATTPASGSADQRDLERMIVFDPMAGLADLEEHLLAMKAEAEAAGIPFNRHGVRNELQAATFRLREARAVRLLVSPTGAVAIEVSLPDSPGDC